MMQVWTIFSELIARLPVVLVWLVGIGLALRMRDRARRASNFALAGLVSLLILSILNVVSGYMPVFIHTQTGMNMNTLSTLVYFIRIILSILTAGAWALILMAIYSDRNQPAA